MNNFFDPNLNLYLQSFQSPWLTTLMLVVSAVGSQEFLLISGLFLLSAVDFKKGAVILHLVLWSFLLTVLLKELFLLPRPIDLEPSLRNVEKHYPALVSMYIQTDDSPGFPSGHVMSTVTFWITTVYMFRGKFQRVPAVLLIILMPLSRMYLGRHFLADVLGGLLIGTCIPTIGLYLLNHSRLGCAFIKDQEIPRVSRNLVLFLVFYFLVLPAILNFIPLFHPQENGLWFGFHLYFFWMIFGPTSKASRMNLERFLVVVSIYIGITVMLATLHFPMNYIWITFITSAAPPMLSLVLTDLLFRLAEKSRA
jgi:membrane-associated phospholipid phosphatase